MRAFDPRPRFVNVLVMAYIVTAFDPRPRFVNVCELDEACLCGSGFVLSFLFFGFAFGGSGRASKNPSDLGLERRRGGASHLSDRSRHAVRFRLESDRTWWQKKRFWQKLVEL